MSVDAKLFVTCDPVEAIHVAQAVLRKLNEWQRSVLDNHWKSKGYNSRIEFFALGVDAKDNWSNGVKVDTQDLSSFCFYFRINGEKRMLHVHLECDCDYSDTYDGYKVIFSIGHWGMYSEIMKQVAQAVESFGDVYYDHNDCDDEDFELVYDFADNSSQFSK